MSLKRVLTTIIGLPIVGLILVFGNKYIIDFIMMLIAVICMFEYFKVIEKVAHPIKWVGYLSTIIIAVASLLSTQMVMQVVLYAIPIILLILFLHVIISNMKTTFKDVAYTFIGIFYITVCILFISLIRSLEHGKIFIGYIFIVAWFTDIFAYLIGKNFGKHFFSKVSAKKTVEGCVAGIIGAVIGGVIYAFLANYYWELNVNSYLLICGVTALLSILSQVGDFIASSIKRFVDLKDYGDLIPGHGGMLDRIDSLIFIAPFAYMFLSVL